MKALVGLLLTVAVAVGYAWVGVRDSQSDTRGRVAALSRAWTQLGGSVVAKSIVDVNQEDVLTCFRYDLATARLDWKLYCFDADRRLVEVQQITAGTASLLSVLPDAEKSPVQIGVAKWNFWTSVLDRIAFVDQIPHAAETAFGQCQDEVSRFGPPGTFSVLQFQAILDTISQGCHEAVSELRVVERNARPVPGLGVAIGTLRSIATDAVDVADGYLHEYRYTLERPVRARDPEATVDTAQLTKEHVVLLRAERVLVGIGEKAASMRQVLVRQGS